MIIRWGDRVYRGEATVFIEPKAIIIRPYPLLIMIIPMRGAYHVQIISVVGNDLWSLPLF